VNLIQKHLTIPIVNMIDEVVAFASKHFPGERSVGLLATTGTVQSRIYHRAFASTGMQLIAPDEATQSLVMEAIYGKEGIKAGFTRGKPRELLLKASECLVEQGAGILILGCTEIPLVFEGIQSVTLRCKEVALLDPTSILAESVSI
jgi:aspartate racemase